MEVNQIFKISADERDVESMFNFTVMLDDGIQNGN